MIPIAKVHLSEEEIEAVTDVMRSGKLREGEKCREFEEKFAQMVGTKYATTMANGTVALHATYMSLIEPGDEVIVPAFTFFATATMVCYAGGRPIFCDIDPRTFTIDLNDLESKITPKTKAIVPVHLFGNACHIDEILDIADRHGLKVIWDAAQAHLTKYKGKDVGSFRDAVCYSFYATKNMTTGEGGMITSNNKQIIKNCILIKHQGQSKKYYHTILGTNYRMTDLQAAIGIVQLEKLPDYTQKRRSNATYFTEHLSHIEEIIVPYTEPFVKHSYHIYTILLKLEMLNCSRAEFAKKLLDLNIQTGINYPVPLHKQPAFNNLHYHPTLLPNAEWVAERCISIPIHPHLGRHDLEYIVSGIKKVINACIK